MYTGIVIYVNSDMATESVVAVQLMSPVRVIQQENDWGKSDVVR